MNDHKSTVVRYLGYRSLPDGGREFDFSSGLAATELTIFTIDAPIAFFRGPDSITIQEATGICYETLKFRLQASEVSPPDRFDLTTADVAQHRQSHKGPAGRVRARNS